MECDVCKTRSSVGYCAECNKLLCDECGVACGRCGALACPDHVHESRSGRMLCMECVRQRKERRAKQKATEEAEIGEQEQVEEKGAVEEAVVLTASAAREIEPWHLSVWSTGVGLALILLASLTPWLRFANLTLTALLVIFVVAIGLFWAVVGVLNPKYFQNRRKCLIGLVLGIVAFGFAAFEIWSEVKQEREEKAQRALGPRAPEETRRLQELKKLMQSQQRDAERTRATSTPRIRRGN